MAIEMRRTEIMRVLADLREVWLAWDLAFGVEERGN